jgi:subtilisin family serine protease
MREHSVDPDSSHWHRPPADLLTRLIFTGSLLFGQRNQVYIPRIESIISANNPPIALYVEDLNIPVDQPNDPLFEQQWYLHPYNPQENSFGTGWIDAWRQMQRFPPDRSTNVNIVVMDAGVTLNHSDFPPDMLAANPDEIPGNGIDDDNDGCVDNDRLWHDFTFGADPCVITPDTSLKQHGTSATSLIMAATGNNLLMSGEASFLPVKIIVAKVMNNEGIVNYSSVKNALAWIRTEQQHGVPIDIVVMNFAGWPISDLHEQNALISQIAESGTIFVAGSGNSPENGGVGWPASRPEVIAVGGYIRDGTHDPLANSGNEIWVAAPDRGITTLCYDGTPYYDYCTLGGTSYAGPQVAAAIAMLRAYQPDITTEEVRELLRITSGKDRTPGMGYGELRWDKLAQSVIPPILYSRYLPLVLR